VTRRHPELADKVAVVTGGSQGIGKAAAARLAAEGATVVLFGHESGSIEATTEELRAAGGTVHGMAGDVAVAVDVERLMGEAERVGGGIDVLVNSAGIQQYGTVADTPEDVWDRVLAVNLKGMYLAAHYAIPLMRRRGGGSIVNVSSVQAISSQRGVAAYAASKGGAISLTTAMAVDHAREGIRVNVVLPGSVDTPMLRASARRFSGGRSEDDVLANWGGEHPLGRVARAEEVGEVIAFLASEASSFVTGAAFRVDGGLLAQLGAALPEDE